MLAEPHVKSHALAAAKTDPKLEATATLAAKVAARMAALTDVKTDAKMDARKERNNILPFNSTIKSLKIRLRWIVFFLTPNTI